MKYNLKFASIHISIFELLPITCLLIIHNNKTHYYYLISTYYIDLETEINFSG